MKIKNLEIIKIRLSLITPYGTAFGVIKDKTSVLIKITTKNGLIGWGETATLAYPMYKSSHKLCLVVYIRPDTITTSL